MPMTLEQYAVYLDSRNLVWPAPPVVHAPKATPKLQPLPQVRVVLWNIYGTLLNVLSGQILHEHPQKFVMDIALDKTVQEFKMWASMTRKPGQPADYMGEIYRRVLTDLRLAASPGEKHPELRSERIWEAIVNKLNQKDYKYDAAMYGPLPDFSRKIAYFFHASLQGTACYAGAAPTLERLQQFGLKQGLLADTQCFSFVQLQRGLAAQHDRLAIDMIFHGALRSLSHEVGGRKPSERLFKHCLTQLSSMGIAPMQVLHVSSRIAQDLAPAKKFGMRTALYVGDRESVQATPEQFKDRATRPDVMVTELSQIAEIVGG